MKNSHPSLTIAHSLRLITFIAVLLLQFGGAQPAAAESAPVIKEGASRLVLISFNSTPYAFNLTLHAKDPDPGDVLTWSISLPASHGTAGASGTGPSVTVTYVPAIDYAGMDKFVVRVSDGHGGADTIAIRVAVAPKIGLVTDVGGVADMGYNWSAYQGLLRAETELGITPALYEPTADAEMSLMLQKCVSDRNRMCIAVGFRYTDLIRAAALANPGVAFAILDAPLLTPPSNLRSIQFAEKQAGFLAGVLAGKMTTTNIIGVVGGMKSVPAVVRFVEGYRNGAQCTNPNARVLIQYAGSFSDPDLGAQIAAQMMAKNADVIFGAAGATGTGAILYSAQHDVWSIGVDTDEYVTHFGNGTVYGAAKVLTSAMKRLDTGVFETVDDLMTGDFSSGTVTYKLADDGVGLAPYHLADSSIPQSTKDFVANVQADIIAGMVNIDRTCRFKNASIGMQDGWVLESTETSEMGGTMDSLSPYLMMGDSARDRQFRSILSFNTAGLPDEVFVTKVTIRIRQAGVVGVNPFTTHGDLAIDIRRARFGNSAALQLGDFQALSGAEGVGAFSLTPLNGWYTADLTAAAFPYINKQGLTQFRLRFALDDNDDMSADFIRFYSGDALALYRPQLLISYTLP